MLLKKITYLIAQIDSLMTEQLNEILHHKLFQGLEASWRALYDLTTQANDNIQVRILDSKLCELEQDMRCKLEFDQTHLFDKVYDAEFGMPGGKPYSLLIGDYYFDLKNSNHILTLNGISQIAAAAFAPFISSIQLKGLGIESYEFLLENPEAAKLILINNHVAWKRFRETDDSCFIGLILPKIIMRRPYSKNTYQNKFFQFKEYSDRNNILWGHPAYLFALTAMHSFAQTAWFDDLNKKELDFIPSWKQTEYFFDHKTETTLNDCGIMTIAQRGYYHPIYCYNSFSVQLPKIYTIESATINAKITGILKYILCVSRFAHYVKIIAREKIGSFESNIDLQNYLNQWIGQYVAANEVPEKMRPIYPLKNAEVIVTNKPGKYIMYQCIMRLVPRLDLESANASLQLITVLGSTK